LPRHGVASSGAMCPTASSGVTPSSSLIRTHASDHSPRPDFSCSPYAERPCRLLSAPAGEWSFPTLSLCSPSRMNAPVPRWLPWCTCPFLPMRRRPSSRGKNESAAHKKPAQQLQCGPSFAVLGEFFLTCSILRFAYHPGCSYRSGSVAIGQPWCFTSKQDTCRYLHVIWICLPPESGNWRREDLHLSSYSVLSAAQSGRTWARAQEGEE
jgi:hypothetical protein